MASALLESLLDEQSIGAASVRTPADAGRLAAAQALLRDGLPRPRDEAWKYTDLRALEHRRYVNGDAAAANRAVDAATLELPGVEGPRLVFVNGFFRADLSMLPTHHGLDVSCTDAAAVTPALTQHVSDTADARADAFVRMNAALGGATLDIDVVAGVRIDEPLHLVLVGATAHIDLAWQLRVQARLGEGASLRLIEHHIAADANAHLGNLVAQYTLASGSRLDLLQLQDGAPATTLIRRDGFRVGRHATLAMHTLETGAQLARHELDVDLCGTGARFQSNGVFALRGRQHNDTHMVVKHNARDTVSAIAWRGVADERSRGVFHGAITIAAGADGADAQLSNKNLLLSPQAEIDSQPALEIYADEVKAVHGATVGQLDEHALFYLRSRGIPLDQARGLLVGAFCNAMFAQLTPASLAAHLERLLAQRLPHAGDAA